MYYSSMYKTCALGGLGDQQLHILFWDPLHVSEIWYIDRQLQVLWLPVKCPLGGVWGDQEPSIFILGPPPYLQN